MSTQPKLINRREIDYVKKRGRPRKILQNLNPKHHPFQRAREYTRALNATKLDKMFAKPFVGALSGSADSIWRVSTVPGRLSLLVSGDCSGELRVWNTATQKLEWSANAHSGFVRGLAVDPVGENIVTCGSDQSINLWSLHCSAEFAKGNEVQPRQKILRQVSFTDCDWQWKGDLFATSGDTVELWDVNRTEPIQTFEWGADTVNTVKFNKVEPHIMTSTSTDRGVVIIDTRAQTPVKKLILRMVSNSLCWNPMEAYNFTIASEDKNLYSFDMRKIEKAKLVHEGHLNAVMAVDYSPTGQEFVTGSYDKTVRIFGSRCIRSRDVYHAKRMQRVFAAKFSLDGAFVFSGSDDTNIRIWKAHASKKLGTLSQREKEYFDYCNAVKRKFKNMPEIRRIAGHRHLPKGIFNAKKQNQFMANAERRRERRFEESTKQTIENKSKKKKVIVAVKN